MTDLSKFIRIQKYNYNTALEEIKNGKKKTHWMWYVFPQIDGLGESYTSKYYAIKSLEEAKDYANHEILYSRLIEMSNELLNLNSNNIIDILGIPDNKKLQASMTLFSKVNKEQIFTDVLEKYFDGKEHLETLEVLENMKI